MTVEVNASWWRDVLAGPDGTITVGGSGERYVMIPTRSRARVAVDISNRTAVRDAVERMLRSRDIPGAGVLSAAAPTGARLGQKWAVDSPGSLREHLCQLLGADVALSVSIGPPRPNQKPIVRAYVDDELRAIAKLGPDPHTRVMVANEAEWVARLNLDPLREVATPQLIHAGSFGASELLVMTVLPLDDDLGVSFERVPSQLMRQLWERESSEGLDDSPYWRDLERRSNGMDDDLLSSLIDEIRRDPRFNKVRTGTWHGDWSPWNVAPASDGSWYVWDWERSAVGVPAAFDLLHLHLQYGPAGFMGDHHGALAAATELGLPAADHSIATRAYLAEILVRHHEAGQSGSDRDERVRQLVRLTADIPRVGGGKVK